MPAPSRGVRATRITCVEGFKVVFVHEKHETHEI